MSKTTRHTAHRVPEDPIAARLRAFDAADLDGPAASFDDIRRGGDRRVRRQRAGMVVAGLAAVAVVGAVATSQLGSNQATELTPGHTPSMGVTASASEPAPHPTTAPSASTEPTAASPTTPAESTAPASAVGEGLTVDLGVATIGVPDDWSVEKTEAFFILDEPTPRADRYCLRDPQSTSLWCDLEIQVGEQVVGNEGGIWQSHQRAGWYHPTDAQPCPAQPREIAMQSGPGYGVDFSAMSDPRQDFGPVGDRTAELSIYSERCHGGETFSPRIWWLPQTGLYIADVMMNPHTEDILATVKFTN